MSLIDIVILALAIGAVGMLIYLKVREAKGKGCTGCSSCKGHNCENCSKGGKP